MWDNEVSWITFTAFSLNVSTNLFNSPINSTPLDKILFEWNKKGYKKIEDIKNDKYNKDDDHVEEIFDYDWINDD